MDYNYYLAHSLKFLCESDAILVMPLNSRNNHIHNISSRQCLNSNSTFVQFMHNCLMISESSLPNTNYVDSCPDLPGGTPLYGLYRYVRPQRVGFFSCCGLKSGIDFSWFWPF